MTYTEIKMIVEEITEIEDISAHSRKRDIADARFIYYALCDKYVDPGRLIPISTHYERMGMVVDRDRTSVIHGMVQWRDLKNSKYWWGSWVYKLVIETLKNRLKSEIWKAPEIEPINCTETEFAILK